MAKNKKLKDSTNTKIMTKKVDRSCKVLLTQDEILKAGDAMSKELADISRLENEAASVAKTFKSKISEAQARLDRNGILVSNKYEYRTVVCTETKDFSKCTVQIKRDDTDELIEDRTMTADERQTKLFDAPADGGEEFHEDEQPEEV